MQSGALLKIDTLSSCDTHLLSVHRYLGNWKIAGNPGGDGLKKYPELHLRIRNIPSFVAEPCFGLGMVIQVEPVRKKVKEMSYIFETNEPVSIDNRKMSSAI